ncbi:hypothetical protein H8F46_08655 [Xenorhabdus nematophila]|uniref:hypothetical protein n=1 Tax=Xenorhabdus nematophila TaxID=628 RepID=UPI0005431915|nr:hypothetical protein [Xenorhabdus nematophila]MCB4427060.1 hypothetical protein [Xenorhabdus nematophila]QNJ38157.1 hypothetical protein H8F46_08655 [Xenorhabdus nematophila]CEF31224.1 conserved hypothetical protein [Xenorhabdus nematophila str. Websteri]
MPITESTVFSALFEEDLGAKSARLKPYFVIVPTGGSWPSTASTLSFILLSFSTYFCALEYSCALVYEGREEGGTTRLLRYSAASCGVTGGIFNVPTVGSMGLIVVSAKVLFPKIINKNIPKKMGLDIIFETYRHTPKIFLKVDKIYSAKELNFYSKM